jgi:hypothetical protein
MYDSHKLAAGLLPPLTPPVTMLLSLVPVPAPLLVL